MFENAISRASGTMSRTGSMLSKARGLSTSSAHRVPMRNPFSLMARENPFLEGRSFTIWSGRRRAPEVHAPASPMGVPLFGT